MTPRAARLSLLGLGLALGGGSAALAGEPEPPPDAAVYEVVGPYHRGYASIPWHAAFSPDGAWLAVVEGYDRKRLSIYDATSRALAWSADVAEQPASFRPAFFADGERICLVEGTDLVVRERTPDGWLPRRRVPLGAGPGIHRNVREIALAPDGSEATLCIDGKPIRVGLGGGGKATTLSSVEDARSASYAAPGALHVTRWSRQAAETLALDGAGRTTRTLPFAVLAASADGKTWLVARGPITDAGSVSLDLVEAETARTLGSFAIDDDIRGALVVQAAFTPDGRHLIVAGPRRGSVRDAKTGKPLQWIREYEGDRLIGFAASPDGRFLLTGGRREGAEVQDQAVLLWRRRGD
jgi:hypothetical protein